MGLPTHIQREIANYLSEIQGIFKPGAKVLLVVDNGSPTRSLMMGDADTKRVIALIQDLESGGPSEDMEFSA